MGKVYKNENKIILQELRRIYKPDGFDWLSYQITKNNILTLHHIIKVSEGGLTDVTNGALLTKKSHRALHICENKDYILYQEINVFLKLINDSHKPLDDVLWRESRGYKKALVKTLYK